MENYHDNNEHHDSNEGFVIREQGTKLFRENLTFMQYLNTFIMTVLMVVSVLIYQTMEHISFAQDNVERELVRMKTIQDINTNNISTLTLRITDIETDNKMQMQSWVEQNYVRKPQYITK